VPEVLRIRGYRFFFFSREGFEPRPIHVERAEKYAKYWLDPATLAESRAFRSHESSELRRRVEAHRKEFTDAWDEHFGQ
jgi:hypothetical protein